MAEVDTVTAEISGSEDGNFTSLAAVATESDTDAETLLLTNKASSSIGVYITSTEQCTNLKPDTNLTMSVYLWCT